MAKFDITFRDFNLGGLSDSPYQGAGNSAPILRNLDLHIIPGLARASRKLETINENEKIDERIVKMVPGSDASIYFVGASGTIWKRNNTDLNGAALSEAVNSGATSFENMIEFRGFMVFCHDGDKIGFKPMPGNTDWSDAQFSQWTLTSGTGKPRFMFIQNDELFITNGNLIARLEYDGATWTYTDAALDVEDGYTLNLLWPVGIGLGAAGYKGESVIDGGPTDEHSGQAKVWNWNTVSDSFTSSDDVPEDSIGAAIPADNSVFLVANGKGNMYSYRSGRLELLRRIPSMDKDGWLGRTMININAEAVVFRNGISLVGTSDKRNLAPFPPTIFGLGRYGANYPTSISEQHVPVHDFGTGGNKEITALAVLENGGKTLFVAWQDGTDFGIEMIPTGASYAKAVIETPVINAARESLKQFGVKVFCRNPSSTDVSDIEASVNGGDYRSLQVRFDEDRAAFESIEDVPDAATVQIRVSGTEGQGFDVEAIQITGE